MKADLSDMKDAPTKDKTFPQNMEENCCTRQEERGETVKICTNRLVALSETTKVLTDDDALEPFEKALTGSVVSFIHVKVSNTSAKA